MLRSIKIRLYPTAHQATQINRLLGSCRVVYNQTLDRKINQYKEHNITENRSTLSYWFHHELLNNPDFEYLKEQNTKVLNQSINDMITAFDRFFKLHTGYPKFKSKHNNKQSCRFVRDTISRRNNYTSYKLSLANIKNIKFRCSKKYAEYLQKHKANIRQATLTKLPCSEYYLSILVDGDLTHKGVQDTNNCIGIDLGVKDFVITSEGEIFNNLHFKKNEIHKLKKLQKQLSRKVKGSNNRNKARIKIAKVYKKINDKKQYYLHQVSNSLINENQVICMEDLNVKGMLKNHKLAESISEMNFGEFKRILEYKARWYNRKLVFVDRFYPSSKTCCHCSYKFKDLKLSDRFWTCSQCNILHNRDINAAVNILNEGLRIIGSSTTEFKLVDYPTMDGDSVMDQKSSDRMKQEVNKEQNSNLFKF
jgi:transposase, IS605 orfB family